jgi:hypothetical protein
MPCFRTVRKLEYISELHIQYCTCLDNETTTAGADLKDSLRKEPLCQRPVWDRQEPVTTAIDPPFRRTNPLDQIILVQSLGAEACRQLLLSIESNKYNGS